MVCGHAFLVVAQVVTNTLHAQPALEAQKSQGHLSRFVHLPTLPADEPSNVTGVRLCVRLVPPEPVE